MPPSICDFAVHTKPKPKSNLYKKKKKKNKSNLELADNIPKDILRWKLKLLKSATAYANSRLHAVKAEVLVLARDYLLSGEDEAQRLSRSLQNCNICYFKDYGQAILLLLLVQEDSFNLLTVIKGTYKYRRSRKHDFVMDFVPPSISECEQALEAHRTRLLVKGTEDTGEKYELFWPEKPEFVRMTAKFGATIVPFGVVGEDDLAEQLVLDFTGMSTLPGLNDDIRRMNEEIRQFRLYFLFGKPIQTKGREEILKDRECAKELYLQIKAEVERNVAYLMKKREEDPYRGIIQRTMYRAFAAPLEGVPAFKP
ncbi:hypothetical protein RJ639_011097 [Escallonia herrerae]|uniref:Uncharacterized protein n=1 Tax=Escallonia herrerae TaxID=1293975 RepID=A0AA88VN18_9ASTE|nr:hypothetical protein RJ639_011097 [Escallonia herrerae]